MTRRVHAPILVIGGTGRRASGQQHMKTPSHETWMKDFQREPRTIREAFQFGNEEQKADDQDRKDEDFLDQERGVWGPTE